MHDDSHGHLGFWGTPVHASDICLTSCMNLIPTVIRFNILRDY